MNSLAFYDELDMLESLEERIQFIETVDYDFSMDAQPDAILQRFIDLIPTCSNWDSLVRIAKAFKKRFGPIAICREFTFCKKAPVTLLDSIDTDYKYEYDIQLAFTMEGFRRLDECNLFLLRNMYCFDPCYEKECDAIYNWYDYEEMKKTAIVTKYDLAMFLWHPSRIQGWIAAGNNIRDYI